MTFVLELFDAEGETISRKEYRSFAAAERAACKATPAGCSSLACDRWVRQTSVHQKHVKLERVELATRRVLAQIWC
jgi:hypothetical protein